MIVERRDVKAVVGLGGACRSLPAVWTDTGPDGRRRSQPLVAHLLRVYNSYALPERPDRFFHALKQSLRPPFGQARDSE